MSRSSLITLFVLLSIVLIAGWFTYQSKLQHKQDQVDTSPAGQALSAASTTPYTDLEGNPLDLTQFIGQVRVVNSWASWCPFCVNELPDFAELATQYKDDGVVVVAINRKEPARTARQFIGILREKEGLIFALDPTDSFYESIGGFAMPETLFYDAAGNIVVHKRGFLTLEEMRLHVEAALTANR